MEVDGGREREKRGGEEKGTDRGPLLRILDMLLNVSSN